jgi:hypothetical protein
MFDETAIVDNHLSFDDQGKQISFSVSVCSKLIEVYISHLQQAN